MSLSWLKVLGIFLWVGLSCSPNRVQLLSERVEKYNNNLRWAALPSATQMVAPEKRKSLGENLSSQLREKNIFDFSILDLSLDKENRTGSAIVEFTYYGVSETNVKTWKEIQRWKYDSHQKNWFLNEIRNLSTPKDSLEGNIISR